MIVTSRQLIFRALLLTSPYSRRGRAFWTAIKNAAENNIKIQILKSSQVVGLRDRVAIIRALLHAISYPHPYAGYGTTNLKCSPPYLFTISINLLIAQQSPFVFSGTIPHFPILTHNEGMLCIFQNLQAIVWLVCLVCLVNVQAGDTLIIRTTYAPGIQLKYQEIRGVLNIMSL